MDQTESKILTVLATDLPAALLAENARHAAEQQTITATGTLTSGTWTATMSGATTAALNWNATASQVRAALAALSPIGTYGVRVSGGPLPTKPLVAQFSGLDVPAMTLNTGSLVGGSLSLTVSGVTVPPVVVFEQGFPPQALALTPAQLPRLNVGCYEDTPLHDDPGDPEHGDFTSLVERPILMLGVVSGASALETHLRAVRFLAALKAVCRAHIEDNMAGAVAYWPLDLGVNVEAAVQQSGGGSYFATVAVEASRARVLEAEGYP